MRIHHLNCISTCPLGGRLMDGTTNSIVRRDVADPKSRLSRFFLSMLKPDFRDDMTAFRQIQALGYHPGDVRHIILTHLDFDHAGGLDDFPQATVHLLAAERDSAFLQKTWLDRQRFRPQQWSTKDRWKVYPAGEGEDWFGLERVRALDGLPPDIALVPLMGHTFGHAGVAVQGGDKWLLQASDAYFHHREMDAVRPTCAP